MPRVGLEPTIPVSERAKTVHALDRAATVIGLIALQYNVTVYTSMYVMMALYGRNMWICMET
jgi:hypothetical protein